MIFHKNHRLADDSHEISYLIFFRKIRKMSQKLLSAAVVIGALRVNKLKGNKVPGGLGVHIYLPFIAGKQCAVWFPSIPLCDRGRWFQFWSLSTEQ